MHDAPSVNFPVGRCSWCHRLQLLAWSVALLSACAVAWWARRPTGWLVALAALWLGGCWWLWPQVQRPSQLQWRSGIPEPARGWWWGTEDAEAERVVELSVLLDLQAGMLLALRMSTKKRVTLWVQRTHAPAQWLSLRQALWHHTGAGQ